MVINHPHHNHHHNRHFMIIFSNVKWLEAGGVQVVPIIVNGSIDQTDYFREVYIIVILMDIIIIIIDMLDFLFPIIVNMNMILVIITLVKILILPIQMFTSLNGLMIPGGPDSSILPDAGVSYPLLYPALVSCK